MTIVSACASPSEPPRNDASCAQQKTGAAVDAAGAGDDAVAGARALAHAPRDDVGAQQRAASRGRTAPRAARAARRFVERLGGSKTTVTALPPGRGTTLWPPKPNEFDSADGRCPVDLERPGLSGHVVEVAALVGLLVARASAAAIAVAQREDRGDRLDRAGGAEQVPDRRLGRGHRESSACSPSTALIAFVSARSLSGVEVPCALT